MNINTKKSQIYLELLILTSYICGDNIRANMTISKNKYVFCSIFTILLLLLLSDLVVMINFVDAGNKETLIFASMSLLLIMIAIIQLFIIYRRNKNDTIRDNYITNIVHDCKTPVTTINLVCQTLNDVDIDSEEMLKYYSEIVKVETSKLIIMIENILNIVRLNNVVLDLNQSVDIHQVIGSTIDSMKFLVKNLNGELETYLEADNPNIKGNYDILLSIILNLITNAIKYSKESPRIIVRTKNVGKSIEISVADNGIGMKERELDNIFEKTYRISSGAGSKGSGFGLYYVKENVKKVNGEINVLSSFGNGSEFRITLPNVK